LDDLDHNWEVLAEAIQTVIRAEVVAGRSSITDPYALLKELTRGHRVGAAELAEFVQGSRSATTPSSVCSLSPRRRTPASRSSSRSSIRSTSGRTSGFRPGVRSRLPGSRANPE